jgi:hypothetical protein
MIDLGAANDAGHNVLQEAGTNANGGVGICLKIDDGAAQMLNAGGNVFAGPRDCSITNPGVITRDDGCGQGADIGINNQNCPPAGCVDSNDIIVLNCTHP